MTLLIKQKLNSTHWVLASVISSVSWIHHRVYFQSHFGLTLKNCSFICCFPCLVWAYSYAGTKSYLLILEVKSQGCAVKKEPRGESGSGDRSKAMLTPNLQAAYPAIFSALVEQEVKWLWKDSSVLQDTAQWQGFFSCREKLVQGWSTLIWLSESVSLALGMGEGDVAVPSDVLLTQKIDLLFFFLFLTCKLSPALFSTFFQCSEKNIVQYKCGMCATALLLLLGHPNGVENWGNIFLKET